MDALGASSSAASPGQSGRQRFWKWAAVRRKAARAASRKRRFEVSGKPIAAIWACESRAAEMSNNVYQMIARAQAEYARCIDDDRLEEWPNHFHGTCVYKITTAANYRDGLEAGIIFANSRGMLTDRVSAPRSANTDEHQSYRPPLL